MKKSERIYEHAQGERTKYDEEKHCVMLLEIYPLKWRISAFCIEALIDERTFYRWVHDCDIFKLCWGIAQCMAQEAWEKEEVDNLKNEDWNRKRWEQRGSRYFAKDKSKLILEVHNKDTPWEQYQQIMKQAQKGDFTASEIKQLMEAVNVGTRVYESFKLQQEVDKMNKELSEMSQRNANNISTNCETKTTD